MDLRIAQKTLETRESPRVVVLACSVLRDLIEPRLTGTDVSVTYLDTGLHVLPGRMVGALAAELDALPSPSTVLLGYGLCGKGLENLESGAHVLVIPRTDDCIAILLGSQDAYLRAVRERPGTYYLSRGWLESGSHPLDQYRALVDQHGRESADYVVDAMYANYRALCLVASTREELEECRPLVREVVDFCAERWGMEYEERVGSGELVRRLIEAPGRPEALGEDFVVIPPGGRVEAGMFLRSEPESSV
jgi:hypothetical protein